MKNNRSGKKKSNSGFLVVLFITVVVVAAILALKSQSRPVDPENPRVSTPMSTVAPGRDTSVTFTHPKYGILFRHDADLLVKQVGNSVYVYDKSISAPENGQYIQIFEKESVDSLSQAVEKRFLSTVSKKDCFMVTLSGVSGFGRTNEIYPSMYERVSISYPDNPSGRPYENAKKCPSPYSRTNGNVYFLADSSHPDVFLFVSVGQYTLPSGVDNSSWHSTIRFIDRM